LVRCTHSTAMSARAVAKMTTATTSISSRLTVH
jgi:hypothetical protein